MDISDLEDLKSKFICTLSTSDVADHTLSGVLTSTDPFLCIPAVFINLYEYTFCNHRNVY